MSRLPDGRWRTEGVVDAMPLWLAVHLIESGVEERLAS